MENVFNNRNVFLNMTNVIKKFKHVCNIYDRIQF